MLPMSCTASLRQLRSSIIANNRVWSIQLNPLRESMFVIQMSLLVSHASSKATNIIFLCLVVLLCGLKTFLTEVADFMFLPITCEQRGECVGIEFVYDVGKGYYVQCGQSCWKKRKNRLWKARDMALRISFQMLFDPSTLPLASL